MKIFTAPFFTDLLMTGDFTAQVAMAAINVGSTDRRASQLSIAAAFAIELEPNYRHIVMRVHHLDDKRDLAVLRKEAKLFGFGNPKSFRDLESFCDNLLDKHVRLSIQEEHGDPFGIVITELLPTN